MGILLTLELTADCSDAIRGGIFGYNGFLVGAGIALFQATLDNSRWNYLLVSHPRCLSELIFSQEILQLAPITVCSMIASILSMAMSHMFANLVGKPAAVFTFPFHIVTWMWLLGSQRYVYFPNALNPPAVVDPTAVDDRHPVGYDTHDAFQAIIISIGQIVFFGEPACGQ